MTAARYSNMNFKATPLSVTKFKISLGDTPTRKLTPSLSQHLSLLPPHLSQQSPPPTIMPPPPVVKIKLISSTFYLLYADENKSI